MYMSGKVPRCCVLNRDVRPCGGGRALGRAMVKTLVLGGDAAYYSPRKTWVLMWISQRLEKLVLVSGVFLLQVELPHHCRSPPVFLTRPDNNKLCATHAKPSDTTEGRIEVVTRLFAAENGGVGDQMVDLGALPSPCEP